MSNSISKRPLDLPFVGEFALLKLKGLFENAFKYFIIFKNKILFRNLKKKKKINSSYYILINNIKVFKAFFLYIFNNCLK